MLVGVKPPGIGRNLHLLLIKPLDQTQRCHSGDVLACPVVVANGVPLFVRIPGHDGAQKVAVASEGFLDATIQDAVEVHTCALRRRLAQFSIGARIMPMRGFGMVRGLGAGEG